MTEDVIVTGSTGGIGRELVQDLTHEGFRVIGVQRSTGCSPSEALDRHSRNESLIIRADLSKGSDLRGLCEFVTAVQPKGLVHLAGFRGQSSIMSLDTQLWISQYAVRVLAFASLIHAMAECPTRERFATTIVSEAAKTGNGVADYVTANGAMIALMASAAREMASRQIRVNAVLTGLVDTSFHTDVERETFRAFAKRITLTGRVTTPSDVSRTLVSLCHNRQVTGSLWPVTGGSWIG